MDSAVAPLVHTDEGFPICGKLSPENERLRRRQLRRLRSSERYPVRLPSLRTVIYRGKLAVDMLTRGLGRRRMTIAIPVSEQATVDAQLAEATGRHEWSPTVTPEVRAVLRARISFAQSRATSRGRAFSLSLDALCDLYDAQEGRCAITGLPFDISSGSEDDRWRRPFPPSIDRIDSALGYTPENIRLVCAAVNNALGPWGEAVFAVIAQAYVTNPRPLSSAVERRVHIADVVGSTPTVATIAAPFPPE